MTVGAGLVRVRGAQILDGVIVWPGSDRHRKDLALHERAWRFLGPAPLRLAPGERFLHATYLHWQVLVRDVTQMGSAPVAAYLFGQLVDLVSSGWWVLTLGVWATVVIHTLMMCHHMMGWRAQVFVVTSHRIRVVKGVFTNRVENINLSRYTDLTIEQSYLQRLLGYGTVRVESGGKHDDGAAREKFHHIPDPELVEDAVYEGLAVRAA
jgi:membrane protein YdbS with pleckstrin-like domain